MKRSVQTRSAATCTLCAVAVCFGIFAWVWQGWAYIQHLWVTVEIPQLHYEGLHTDAKEVYMAMSVLVTPHGYPLEEHLVQTSDGYILRLFRIPRGNGKGHEHHKPLPSGERASRPVVYLQHPLMDSSAGWAVLGPGKGLAFVLADAGYDVWMGNVRGNRFSRQHETLDPDTDEAFWHFSWQHHAAYDLPASLEYVAHATGQATFPYIGYSQGTTIALAALASEPNVRARISHAVLLAPVAFTANMRSPVFKLMAFLRIERLLKRLRVLEYGGYTPQRGDTSARFCALAPGACVRYLFMLCGSNPFENVQRSLLPLFMQYYPAGTSSHNMRHWGQAVLRGERQMLRRFDYGSRCTDEQGKEQTCNQHIYADLYMHAEVELDSSAALPPAYNLSAINIPLALFSGGRDTLSTPQDVAELVKVLGPRIIRSHHHVLHYAHLDYGMGLDAAERVWPHVLAFLAQPDQGVDAACSEFSSCGRSYTGNTFSSQQSDAISRTAGTGRAAGCKCILAEALRDDGSRMPTDCIRACGSAVL